MHELFAIKNVYSLYEGNQLLVMLGIMVIAFYPLLVIIKKLILPSVGKIVDKKIPIIRKFLLSIIYQNTWYGCLLLYILCFGVIF